MDVQTVLSNFVARVTSFGPRALFLLVLLLVGVLLSVGAGKLVRWAVRRSGLEALAEKAGISPLLYVVGVRKGLGTLLGGLTKFTGLLLTLAALADALHLSAVSTITALAVQLLPRLLLAGVVLLGGLSLATVAKRFVQRMADESGTVDSPNFVAHVSYWVIVVITVTWSVEQAGLSTDIISSLTKIVFGAILAAVALAFGLGFRSAMGNIVARHYYEKMLAPGDRVRVGEQEGLVVRFTPVALVLDTERGEVIIPCQKLMDGSVQVQPVTVPTASDAGRESHPSESPKETASGKGTEGGSSA